MRRDIRPLPCLFGGAGCALRGEGAGSAGGEHRARGVRVARGVRKRLARGRVGEEGDGVGVAPLVLAQLRLDLEGEDLAVLPPEVQHLLGAARESRFAHDERVPLDEDLQAQLSGAREEPLPDVLVVDRLRVEADPLGGLPVHAQPRVARELGDRTEAAEAKVARLQGELANIKRATIERCVATCSELAGTFGDLVDADGGTAELLFEGEIEEVIFNDEEEAANAQAGAVACREALRALLPEVPHG